VKQWEYLVKTSQNAWGEVTQNLLDNLGENGWELVGVTHSDTTRYTTLFFKRERLTTR